MSSQYFFTPIEQKFCSGTRFFVRWHFRTFPKMNVSKDTAYRFDHIICSIGPPYFNYHHVDSGVSQVLAVGQFLYLFTDFRLQFQPYYGKPQVKFEYISSLSLVEETSCFLLLEYKYLCSCERLGTVCRLLQSV